MEKILHNDWWIGGGIELMLPVRVNDTDELVPLYAAVTFGMGLP